ncbi:MAG: preprotein translocase subunit SecE [Pirellulales bacterium]|nr:preprotein translocase subunit SecE [Pirellulales bacterium]
MTRSTFWGEMFSAAIYKRQQGRIARQVTFGALIATLGIGFWRLSQFLVTKGAFWQFGIPLVLFAVGAWLAFRLVNYPPFADFLVAVEAEMSKVSWPTRPELFRSSLVVMITIFGLAALLAVYDLVLHTLLTALWKLGK